MLLRLNYTYIIQTNRPALQPKFFVEHPFELFVPAVFFVGRKLKPQSNKSHRAMHGSSPCGAIFQRLFSNERHLQGNSTVIFYYDVFYLPRLSDILCEAILKRTINQQDALMKLTKKNNTKCLKD